MVSFSSSMAKQLPDEVVMVIKMNVVMKNKNALLIIFIRLSLKFALLDKDKLVICLLK
jgi:hypothetical protein